MKTPKKADVVKKPSQTAKKTDSVFFTSDSDGGNESGDES